MSDPPRMRNPRRRPSEELRPFGRWFLTELAQRGWSQADFARHAGSTPRRISDWLYRSVPDLGSVVKIAETLAIPMETVVYRALDRELRAPSSLAAEIGELARTVPDELLMPFAIALRSLQDKPIQAAALRELARRREGS